MGKLVEQLADLKVLKADKTEELKVINGEISKVEFILIPLMEDQEMEKFSSERGTASLKIEQYPQIEDKSALLKWAYENDKPDIFF